MPRVNAILVAPALLTVVVSAAATDPDLRTTFPDSPTGRRVAAWVDAFNADGPAADRRASSLSQRWGRLEQPLILGGDDRSLAMLARSSRTGQWLRGDFEIRTTPPAELISARLAVVADPGRAPAAATGWTALEELVPLAQALGDLDLVGVAIVRNRQVVDVATIGGLESSAPIPVGEISKSLTATVIGRLADTGTLDLDDTLDSVLPGTAMHDAYRAATVEDLLDDRAGLPFVAAHDAEPGTILGLEPVGTPGQDTVRTDAGVAVALHVAGRGSGRTGAELLRSELLEPAGLTDSHVDDRWSEVRSSLDDLTRFARLHLEGLQGRHGLLRAPTVRRLHKAPGESEYAAGWVVVENREGVREHWTTGAADGYYTQISILPRRDLAIVVVLRASAPDGAPIARSIVESIWRHPDYAIDDRAVMFD